MPFTFPATWPYKWIAIAVATLLALAAVYFAINAYGDARYDAGKAQSDKEWKAAADLLDQQSQGAADAADIPASERAADYAKRLEDERIKIGEAVDEGRSPFDALFPADGVPAGQDSPPVAPRPVAP